MGWVPFQMFFPGPFSSVSYNYNTVFVFPEAKKGKKFSGRKK